MMYKIINAWVRSAFGNVYLCVPFLRVGHQFQLQTPRHVPPTVGSENQDCGALYHEPSCWCEVHSPELSIFSATANHMTKPRGPQPYSPNWSKIPFILQRKIWIYPPLVRHAKRDGVLVCFSFGAGRWVGVENICNYHHHHRRHHRHVPRGVVV